jgi:RNA polymerase sigma factor (sigma-70 family)
VTLRGRQHLRESAFDRLFVENREPLLAYFLRRVDHPCDAADLLAEVFLVAWRRLDEVPSGRDATLWLYGVARRVLANHRRGARRRNDLAIKLRSALDRPLLGPPDVDRVDGDSFRRVRLALDLLPEIDREIITLKAWDGLSALDISVVVGGTPENVRVRLHRARARLRALLEVPSSEEQGAVP